ncbi:hypothetical protein BH09PSE2_BH09PSE2_19570 [soil metagenome]
MTAVALIPLLFLVQAAAPAVAPRAAKPAAAPASAPAGPVYALALSDSNRAILVNLSTVKMRGAAKTFSVIQVYPGLKSYDQNQTNFDYEVVSQVIKCGVETQTILKAVQFALPDGAQVSESKVSEFGDPIVLDTYPWKLMQFVCGEKLTEKTRQLPAKDDLDVARRVRAAYPNLIGY